ncbi:MAG: hypothetical protein UT05_C0003G0001 [Parcubacteria group bacterium GW2011_GWF2_38_76]|nr:MAG: hypothetical protein UT05_C0003G0001 [Parcubacteria group bacterium GW2011_GWF2_38_76]HBM46224.1 hypothetical protein [Patescibacteria group bacterium]
MNSKNIGLILCGVILGILFMMVLNLTVDTLTATKEKGTVYIFTSDSGNVVIELKPNNRYLANMLAMKSLQEVDGKLKFATENKKEEGAYEINASNEITLMADGEKEPTNRGIFLHERKLLFLDGKVLFVKLP